MRSIHRMAGLAMVSMIATGTLSAQTLLNDNFNGENGGLSSLKYTTFANWTVTGNVDLVATSGGYGIECSGACVDLDGTTGPGTISTRDAYQYFAGDKLRFQFDVSGSQDRNGNSAVTQSTVDNLGVGFLFSGLGSLASFTSTTAVAPVSSSVQPLPGDKSNVTFQYSLNAFAPFSTWTYDFTAMNDGTIESFSLGTTSSDNIGPIVDNVLITRLPDAAVVPEPGSLLLLGAGLLGLVGIARRRSTV